MTKTVEAAIRLSAIPNFGPSRARKLLTKLHSQDTKLEFLTEFDLDDLRLLGMNDAHAEAFVQQTAIELAEKLVDSGVKIATWIDDDVPAKVKRFGLSPWYFYYGDISILNNDSVGFSGSRDASPEALEVTYEIARAAAERNWSVISGGARGVDMTAHKSALDAGGGTVVILPQGFSTWRMPDDLNSSSTLVMSEFAPLDDWGSYRAMQRNKSIIHLSDRLIIPQAGVRGGTMNAGEYALKQKHPTWVVDLGPEYRGNVSLVSQGAAPLRWTGEPGALDDLSLPVVLEKPSQQSLF